MLVNEKHGSNRLSTAVLHPMGTPVKFKDVSARVHLLRLTMIALLLELF